MPEKLESVHPKLEITKELKDTATYQLECLRRIENQLTEYIKLLEEAEQYGVKLETADIVSENLYVPRIAFQGSSDLMNSGLRKGNDRYGGALWVPYSEMASTLGSFNANLRKEIVKKHEETK